MNTGSILKYKTRQIRPACLINSQLAFLRQYGSLIQYLLRVWGNRGTRLNNRNMSQGTNMTDTSGKDDKRKKDISFPDIRQKENKRGSVCQ